MAKSFTERKRIRKDFGPSSSRADAQSDRVQKVPMTPSCRSTRRRGSQQQRSAGSLQVGFPISDFSERGTLEFVSYEFEQPKYDVEEACCGYHLRRPAEGYAAPGRFDVDEETGARRFATSRSRMSIWATCPDDEHGHLRRERHERDRLADAPVARRVLRS